VRRPLFNVVRSQDADAGRRRSRALIPLVGTEAVPTRAAVVDFKPGCERSGLLPTEENRRQRTAWDMRGVCFGSSLEGVPVGLTARGYQNSMARGHWLTRERVIGYATILALTELGLFVFCVAGAHGLIVPMDHATSTDFLSFHAAGALANAGTPWLVYDRAAHQAAEQAAIGVQTAYNYFYYPPVFLLVCAPLARLPYLVAFITFQAVQGLACFLALRMIRHDLPIAVFLAFPGFWWAIGTGQNALLTAALFAAGTALIDRRPWLSGLCLGALCYKPHFGLLLPVALIAGGHWRAFAGAAAMVLTLIGASVALFGAATWQAFLTAAQNSGEIYAAHAIFMGGLTSPFGALMTLGSGREVAYVVQGVVTLMAAGVVALVWRQRRPPQGGDFQRKRHRTALPVRAAILLAATPLAVPVLMFYDLMLVFVGLVWLTRVCPETGALLATPPWARSWRPVAMAVVFLCPLLSGNLGGERHWLLAAITAAAAFGLTLTVAWPNLSALGSRTGAAINPS
jgi:alpha-1,2-mannosyltransferase